jgi:hypothetical protein
MLRGILQALGEVKIDGDVDGHIWNIVLARTAQIIEAMSSQYDLESFDSIENGKGAS